MATHTVDKAIEDLAQSSYEINQAGAEGLVEAQKRTVEFAKEAIEQGIAVLRDDVEVVRSLVSELTENPQRPQDVWQAVLDTTASAQERHIRYTGDVLESGANMLREQIGGARSLAQTVVDQAQRQQQALRTLVFGTIDGFLDIWNIPFAYAQQGLETAESIALRGVESASRVAKQGLETVQEATHEAASAVGRATNGTAGETSKATHQGKQAAHKAAK